MLVTNVASSLSSSSITAIGGNGGTGTSPSGQEVSKALDNNTATQYTNLDGINSGLVFDLGKLKRADRFPLTTATDKPANDPTSAKIFGSKDGITFIELSDTEFVDVDFTAQKSSKTTTPFFKNNELRKTHKSDKAIEIATQIKLVSPKNIKYLRS